MTFNQFIELHPELQELSLEEQMQAFKEYLDEIKLCMTDEG